MVFTSPLFLFIFLPAVLALYFLRKSIAYRNLVLLVMSLVFYAWGEGQFFLVMVGSIFLNYYFGIQITKHVQMHSKRRWLAAGVTLNLAILIYFKYAGFIVENLSLCLVALHHKPLHEVHVHLPAGVSFFTFHALSYVIDVYRGHFKAQRNPIDLGLYIAFFPQLIAGPIVRYEFIGPAIEKRESNLLDFSYGIQRFVIGLGKKALIADALSPVVEKIFALPLTDLTTSLTWLGAIFYTLQIYFDFSGYSDMAIGMARMFGFRFNENFNYPYIAKNITDFWRRWHISLSSWFRDYLYIPLGGNRVGHARQYVNLFIVFFICGLWHGASWSFVVWGLFHGTLLVMEKAFLLRRLERVPVLFARLYTLFAVLISWILFRSETLAHALAMIGKLFGINNGAGNEIPLPSILSNDILLVAALGIFGATPVFKKYFVGLQPSATASDGEMAAAAYVWAGLCVAFLFAIMLLSAVQIANNTFSPFIYYRF